MKVLIIDDDDDVRTIARLSLGRIGRLTVVEASDGVEGVEKAAAERPDVIVLDVMMPGMDGPATLEVLRARPDMRDMPVIFLTAKVLRSEVERLRRLGALAVFEKPFNPRTLADDLQRALGRQAS